MGKKPGLELNNETVILPFQKEFSEIIDGFGYEWKEDGTDIIVNLDKKNLRSDDYGKSVDNYFSPILDPILKNKKKVEWVLKYIKSRCTILKGSAIKEILADITLFIILLLILNHFTFVIFTLLGIAIDLMVIATLVRSFISSTKEILWSDQTLLSKKFGFSKTDRGFETSSYNILKELKRSKYIGIFSSGALLTISILSFTYPSPPLIYVTSVINFTGLFLASLYMGFQYYMNGKKHKKIKGLKPTLLAVVLAFLFFFVYVLNYFIYYKPIAFFSAFFIDIIFTYSVFYFARDLIRINRFREWADSNHDIH